MYSTDSVKIIVAPRNKTTAVRFAESFMSDKAFYYAWGLDWAD